MIEAPLQTLHEFQAESSFYRARQILSRYLPFVLPHEPTRIEAKAIDDWAIYRGPLNGHHYVYVDIGGYSSDLELTFSLLHELPHQWHAEQIGAKNWYTIDPDTIFTQEDYETQTSEVLFQRLEEIVGEDNSLTDALSEGLATFVELYVLNRCIRESIEVGDEKTAATLIALKNEHWPEWAKRGKKTSHFESHHHEAGYKLISKMIRWISPVELFNWACTLNYAACNEIMEGTRDYKHALNHPRKIPKLATVKK